MNSNQRRWWHGLANLAVAFVALAAYAGTTSAHDFKLGPLRIDHPYALPTVSGETNGAAYLRSIRNTGDQRDRLIGASTPVARMVEIHRGVIDAHNVMRMRQIESIELPPRAEVQLRHGGEYQLMLVDLKQPLRDGDRFPMTLRFERAGEREVTVWVQTPRSSVLAHQRKH